MTRNKESFQDWLHRLRSHAPPDVARKHVPEFLKDSRKIDVICSSCRSIPWEAIRDAVIDAGRSLHSPVPTVWFKQNCQRGWKEELFSFRHASMDAIIATASQGCHVCLLVLYLFYCPGSTQAPSVFRPYSPAALEIPARRYSDPWLDSYSQRVVFWILYKRNGRPPTGMLDFGHGAYRELVIALDPSAVSHPDLAQRRCPTIVSSCRHWLRTCTQTHTVCVTSDNYGPKLPHRVVFLDTHSGVLAPRLLVSGTKTGRYVALSHRWSTSRSVMLTSETQHELEQGIKIEDLSQTFQEAFQITSDLGFDYIWVDSLCILQDNKQDWAQQSSQMARIYSEASLTICAYTDKDGSGSCTGSYSTNLVDWPWQVTPDLYVYQGEDLDYIPEGTARTRAWIMQEEYLSRRVLYCGQNRSYWRCREMHSASDRPWAVTENLNKTPLDSFTGKVDLSVMTIQETHPVWQSIVHEYSLRDLSFATDTLPAISALAQRSQHLLNDSEKWHHMQLLTTWLDCGDNICQKH